MIVDPVLDGEAHGDQCRPRKAGKEPSPTLLRTQVEGITGCGPPMVVPTVTYWMFASQKVKPVAGLPSAPAEK